MKFSILPELLRPHVNRCERIVKSDMRSPMRAIHACIEIRATPTQLEFRAQDPSICYRGVELVGGVEDSGVVLVDCAQFGHVLKTRFDSVPMHVWVERESLHIKQGEFRCKLPLLRTEEMQPVDFSGPFEFEARLSYEHIADILRCGSSIDDDSSCQGLLLDFTGENIFRIVGISQSVLQVASHDLPHEKAMRRSMAPIALGVLAAFPSAGCKLGIDESGEKIFFVSEEVSLRVSTVEDTYPIGYHKYLGLHKWPEKVFPIVKMNKNGEVASEKPRSFLTFNRDDTLAAISAVASVLIKGDALVTMTVGQKAGDRLVAEFAAENKIASAKASEKVLVGSSDLENVLEIGLPHQKILQCLKSYKADTFTMQLGGAGDTILLLEEGREHMTSFYVPLRVQ